MLYEDNTATTIGERGTVQYAWSDDIEVRIAQFNFQLVRTHDASVLASLAQHASEILATLQLRYANGAITRPEFLSKLAIMYKLTAYVRDPIAGKGEYRLAYMLLDVWNAFHPGLAQFMFECFLVPASFGETVPLGCWKDVKYMHKFYPSSLLTVCGTRLMINQLRIDEHAAFPSLAAKWVPREKSACGGLFEGIALRYNYHYMQTATSEHSKYLARAKAKTDFRKMVSRLNHQLNTVQVKQCAREWKSIVPEQQTALTMRKQVSAFLNENVPASMVEQDDDRRVCAQTFAHYAASVQYINGTRVDLASFVRDAASIHADEKSVKNSETVQARKSILDAQWRACIHRSPHFKHVLPIVDMSRPMHHAIAAALCIAEHSIFGRRVLVFGSRPELIHIPDEIGFCDAMKLFSAFKHGDTDANFNAALSLVLDAISETKLHASLVKALTLVVFSDMQMSMTQYNLSVSNNIKQLYARTGLKTHGVPYDVPHIAFWNMRTTNGFPVDMHNNGVSMLSGYNLSALNMLTGSSNNDVKRHQMSNWERLVKTLNKPRYKDIEQFLYDIM